MSRRIFAIFFLLPSLLLAVPTAFGSDSPGHAKRKLSAPSSANDVEEGAWTFGLQVGGLFNSGFSAQKLGVADGALNLGAGMFLGTLILSGDYVYFFTDGDRSHLSYRDLSGRWTPYVAGGAELGLGLTLRA